jgi:curved DNA-binding protein CbpA
VKDYYELLNVPPSAPPEEVKLAFRREIARYHPDKVHHLGQEFQALAAARASELTEAYAILMDAGRRAQYDDQRRQATAARATAQARESAPASTAAAVSEPPPPAAPDSPPATPQADEFLRKAALGRFKKAVEMELDAFEELGVRGFDAGYVSRSRAFLERDWKSAFKRQAPVKLLGRVVPRVDAAAVDEIWPLALRQIGPEAPVCVFLMGATLASVRELADAISAQRRRHRSTTPPVIVPVDVRTWQALIPADTPPTAKAVVERLRDA